MSTEYSQAVRDVVRAIGENPLTLVSGHCHALAFKKAISVGLVFWQEPQGYYRYQLTDRGLELLREMLDEEKARKSDRYPMCADQPAQIDCRRAACQYHDVGDGCVNSSPAITLNADSYHVQCWSFKVREPHPEPVPEPEPGGYCSKADCINRNPATRRCTLSEPRVILPEFARASCLDYEVPFPEPELKPCPFCGGEVYEKTHDELGCFRIACKGCGASSQRCCDRQEAIGQWNRRA